jgi:ribosomal-protein-alanine N-acetyltransferase
VALIVLETERLRLRQLSAVDDAAFILRLLNDDSFLRYIGDRGVRTVEDAERYILDGPADSYARNGYGLYCVDLAETGEATGICGLVRRPALAEPDIGFAFLPGFRGRGLALEAARAVVDHARDDLGLRRILAIVSPDNERSERLLLKLGMRYECRIRLNDEKTPLKLFALDA